MNLADAIRLGCTMSAPRQCSYIMQTQAGLEACAIGAAALAVMPMSDEMFDVISITTQRWPELEQVYTTCDIDECPDAGEPKMLHDLITHWNDYHGFSREYIADLLDSQTLDLSPVTVPVKATNV